MTRNLRTRLEAAEIAMTAKQKPPLELWHFYGYTGLDDPTMSDEERLYYEDLDRRTRALGGKIPDGLGFFYGESS
jgi:hypothetical protein